MKFKSTREKSPAFEFSDALFAGLAPDGGLYVPEEFPSFETKGFSPAISLVELASKIMAPFIAEPSLKDSLKEICTRAFNFPIPVEKLDDSTSILELFHGPTAAFKDVGARFLAECISHLPSKITRTVIVATSGDTGGAVAGAFHKKKGINVIILYPQGMVSVFQEKQLTCWGDNVRAFSVRGNFDDCQRLVKGAFFESAWKPLNLVSANSINIGRILPQTIYYAQASLKYSDENKVWPNFIIPSGNLGNSIAAFWAKKMGFPIGKIILACNANHAVPDYFKTGKWQPQPTLNTVANAMDVGNPSNMERLLNLYPHLEDLREDSAAFSVSDDEIKSAITEGERKWGRIFCPHTAAAVWVHTKLSEPNSIIVGTAHAAKFREVVAPLIKGKIVAPASVTAFENKSCPIEVINPELESLASALR
jgi:threonine synthase